MQFCNTTLQRPHQAVESMSPPSLFVYANMATFWHIEYGRNDSVPILSIAFHWPVSFCLLPFGSSPLCKKCSRPGITMPWVDAGRCRAMRTGRRSEGERQRDRERETEGERERLKNTEAPDIMWVKKLSWKWTFFTRAPQLMPFWYIGDDHSDEFLTHKIMRKIKWSIHAIQL